MRVVFDVGANVGDTVAHYLTHFPAPRSMPSSRFRDVHRHWSRVTRPSRACIRTRAAVTDSAARAASTSTPATRPTRLLRLEPRAIGLGRFLVGRRLDSAIEVPGDHARRVLCRESIDRIDSSRWTSRVGKGWRSKAHRPAGAARRRSSIYLEVTLAPLYEGQAYFCDVTRILDPARLPRAGFVSVAGGERGLRLGRRHLPGLRPAVWTMTCPDACS